mgnify:FL=1
MTSSLLLATGWDGEGEGMSDDNVVLPQKVGVDASINYLSVAVFPIVILIFNDYRSRFHNNHTSLLFVSALDYTKFDTDISGDSGSKNN